MSLVLNILANYGRRHSKLLTNCHVSWDTLYLDHIFSRHFAGVHINIKLSERKIDICQLPPKI